MVFGKSIGRLYTRVYTISLEKSAVLSYLASSARTSFTDVGTVSERPLDVFSSNELNSRAQCLFQKREGQFILKSLRLALNGPRARLSCKSLVAVSLSCVPLDRALDINALCSCFLLLCKI